MARATAVTDLLAEAERVGTAIRDAVRDGHALLRDLKAATREARSAMAAVDEHIAASVEGKIEAAVGKGLNEYKAELGAAIERADKALADRFDTLAAIYLGDDPKSRREGKPSLAELAERRRQRGG